MSAADRPRRTAAIVGLAGRTLGAGEGALCRRMRPLGCILFARNCGTPDQIRTLVGAFRTAVDDPAAPVLIDQEGGRVTRLKPPAWDTPCALRRIGELAEASLERAAEAAWLHARLIAADLEPLGITVNCAPVLDLGLPGRTSAIGDRAFSADPRTVAVLGRAMIEGYLAGGILPVIKHLPGHGRAAVDSHLGLPVVRDGRATLRASDWQPFSACADAPLGMTAHILYCALDPQAPATQSARVIAGVIRGEIGFEGALLSDDLSMQALGGSLGARASLARQAGCDLALHCNGDPGEMAAVLEAAGPLDGRSLERVTCALARRQAPMAFDAAAAKARLGALLVAVELRSVAGC